MQTDPVPPRAPANDPLDVVTLGEAMVLWVADETGPLESVGRFTKRTAGAETNVAVGLARLGLRVAWGSRVGDDSFGRFLLGEFEREGVDCRRVTRDRSASTGFMLKGRVDDGGDPPIEYHRRGSAASRMTPDDFDPSWPSRARLLHATGIFPALSPGCRALAFHAIDTLRAAGRPVTFDPNLRPSLWPSTDEMREAVNALALRSDCVLPGLDEGRLLTGAADASGIARFYRERGVPCVIVKCGADGAYFDDAQAGCGHVPAHPVARVVDTVGAGDAFAVGVISGRLEGLGLGEAVRRAAWLGARTVGYIGDTEGLPTREQLLAAAL
jgi:sugar/nucleoside kinase (ribokinase family)